MRWLICNKENDTKVLLDRLKLDRLKITEKAPSKIHWLKNAKDFLWFIVASVSLKKVFCV